MLIDPLGALVKAIFLWKDEKEKEQWTILIMSISFSNLIAFFGSVGSSLLITKSWIISIGIGMVTVSTITLALLLKSPLASKLTLMLRPEEVKEYEKQLSEGLTTIEPKK